MNEFINTQNALVSPALILDMHLYWFSNSIQILSREAGILGTHVEKKNAYYLNIAKAIRNSS